MDDLDQLVAALEAAGCEVRGRKVVCSFHGDRSASGSIYTGADGRPRYRCHACDAHGDAADIIALHSGRPLAEVLRDRRDREQPMADRPAPRPVKESQRWPTLEALITDMGARVVATYAYSDPTTRAVELAVIRTPDKSFLQASPAPGGGWWFKKPAGLLPLYNRVRILAADVVVLVEGERDVHALHDVGVIATTCPMGADSVTVSTDVDGKPGLCDLSPLAGKRVVLWGDNDEPGRRHLERCAHILGRLHPRPQLLKVQVEDLDGAKDAAELIEMQATMEAAQFAVRRVIDNARPIHAAASLHRRVEDAIAGRLSAIPWPWPTIGNLTQALLPGAVTLLAGAAGATKSFVLLQSVLWWQAEGYRCALYELEEDQGFWLGRALALVSGIGAATDPAWLAMNPDQARLLLAKHGRVFDNLAAAMTTAPPEGVTLPGLATWIEAQAKSGARIIVADPVTAAIEDGDKPWTAAQKFMLRAKRAATDAGASLILSSHPRKGDTRNGKTVPDLDSLAGGAAYGRFASTVLWLEAMAEPESVAVVDADGRQRMVDANRRVRVLKSRNGRGSGMAVAMSFDGGRLSTSELGVIVSTDAQAQRATRIPARRKQHDHPPIADEDAWPDAQTRAGGGA